MALTNTHQGEELAPAMPFRFLDLPAELRFMVYERIPSKIAARSNMPRTRMLKLLYTATTHHHILNDPSMCDGKSFIQLVTKSVPTCILATCHKIRKEAQPFIDRKLECLCQEPNRVIVDPTSFCNCIRLLNMPMNYEDKHEDVQRFLVRFNSWRAFSPKPEQPMCRTDALSITVRSRTSDPRHLTMFNYVALGLLEARAPIIKGQKQLWKRLTVVIPQVDEDIRERLDHILAWMEEGQVVQMDKDSWEPEWEEGDWY
ncbi:hypothetical protein N0V90_001610 [Kalmusia sp. IMI 367209]|nr:hypothetical protein N0V90_001610 [Kalmusia sp. IMI 367209]